MKFTYKFDPFQESHKVLFKPYILMKNKKKCAGEAILDLRHLKSQNQKVKLPLTKCPDKNACLNL